MKKLLLFITGILAIGAFLSCSGDEPKMTGQDADSSVREPFSTNTNLRTLEEAAAIVRANMGLLGETGSRSAACRSFNPSSAKMVVNYGKSRAQLPDTLMYVFNFDNDEGFAIVAADRRLEGLIAITGKGSYDPAVGTDNPGLKFYMDAAEANITWELDSLNRIPEDTTNYFDPGNGLLPGGGGTLPGHEGNTGGNGSGNSSGGNDDFSTLAQQKWEDDTFVIANTGARLGVFNLGQNYPEGMLCSNNTSGCAITAMYMTMSYFEHPSKLFLDYDKNNTQVLEIDWSDLKKHRQSFYSDYALNQDQCTAERHNTIAKICRYLGYHADAKYGWVYDSVGNPLYGETSASASKVLDVMKNIGFRVSTVKNYQKYDALNSFARQNAIVMLAVKINDSGRHRWIMDGLRIVKYVHRLFIKYDGDPTWYPNGENEYTSNMIHMNWGWNGQSNGWYSSGVFNPGHVSIPDTQFNSDPDKYYTDYSLCTEMEVSTITL